MEKESLIVNVFVVFLQSKILVLFTIISKEKRRKRVGLICNGYLSICVQEIAVGKVGPRS